MNPQSAGLWQCKIVYPLCYLGYAVQSTNERDKGEPRLRRGDVQKKSYMQGTTYSHDESERGLVDRA